MSSSYVSWQLPSKPWYFFTAEAFSECIELTRFGGQPKEGALLDDDIIDDDDLKTLDRPTRLVPNNDQRLPTLHSIRLGQGKAKLYRLIRNDSDLYIILFEFEDK